jgi:hypothetical protein
MVSDIGGEAAANFCPAPPSTSQIKDDRGDQNKQRTNN